MSKTIQPIALKRSDAAEFANISESNMDNLIRVGRFPKPRQVSPGRVVFLVSELTEWMHSRPVSQILPPANTGAPKPKRSATQAGRQVA